MKTGKPRPAARRPHTGRSKVKSTAAASVKKPSVAELLKKLM